MDRVWLRGVCMREDGSCVYELYDMALQGRGCPCLVSFSARTQNCYANWSCVLLVYVQSVRHSSGFSEVPERECKGELSLLLGRGKTPLVISENLNSI